MTEKEKELLKKFLKRVSIFRNFSGDHLDLIVDNFRIIRFGKGEDIVFQADEGTDLFVVLKGKVRVSLLGPEGDEFVLTTFRQGDFFGEMSLIDGKSRSANVVAEEESVLSSLKRDVFLETMKEKPSIAFDMLTALVDRLRHANDMIETLAFLDVNERIVKFLADTARIEGERDEDGRYRVRKRTHNEIASNIGSSREAVSKALKVLAHKGMVSLDGDFFVLSPEAVSEAIGQKI
jgi:CRP-like cAMP-binding protein